MNDLKTFSRLSFHVIPAGYACLDGTQKVLMTIDLLYDISLATRGLSVTSSLPSTRLYDCLLSGSAVLHYRFSPFVWRIVLAQAVWRPALCCLLFVHHFPSIRANSKVNITSQFCLESLSRMEASSHLQSWQACWERMHICV